MRQHLLFLALFTVFLALIFSSFSAPNSREVQGVSPQEKSIYRQAQEFRCRDGSKRIPFSSVNDDYCDCPDGSDEPGTSACSPNGFFFCVNKGFKSKSVPSSRVNDNICDCCDGSDENINRNSRVCTNTCSKEAEKLIADRRDEILRQIEGRKIKETLIKEGEIAYEQKKQDLVIAKNRLADYKVNLEKAEAELNAMSEDKEKADEILSKRPPTIKGILATIKNYANRLLHIVETAVTQNGDDTNSHEYVDDEEEEAAPAKIEELDDEDGGEDEEYDDEDDEEVSDEEDSVPAPNSHSLKKGENKVEEAPKSEKMEEATGKFTAEELKAFEEKLASQGKTVDSFVEEHTSKANVLKSIKSDVHTLEGDVTALEDIFKTDFGENNEYFYLYGKTLELKTDEYTYKLEPFKSVKQNRVSLGTFDKWTGKTAILFSNGEQCWGGPKREITVVLHCGVNEEILRIEEPRRCQYSMALVTPGACSAEVIQELEQELNSLELVDIE